MTPHQFRGALADLPDAALQSLLSASLAVVVAYRAFVLALEDGPLRRILGTIPRHRHKLRPDEMVGRVFKTVRTQLIPIPLEDDQ